MLQKWKNFEKASLSEKGLQYEGAQVRRDYCEENCESKSHWLISKSWLSFIYFSAVFLGLFTVLLSP